MLGNDREGDYIDVHRYDDLSDIYSNLSLEKQTLYEGNVNECNGIIQPICFPWIWSTVSCYFARSKPKYVSILHRCVYD